TIPFRHAYGRPTAFETLCDRAGESSDRSTRRALSLDQHATQDLAGERLGDLVDELDAAHLLVGRDPLGHVGHQLLRSDLASRHDERLRHLAALLVWTRHHGGVADRRV